MCSFMWTWSSGFPPFVLLEHAIIRTHGRRHTFFFVGTPIAAASYECTEQPSSGRMYQKVQKENHTAVAFHSNYKIYKFCNYMYEYSCGRPDDGCFLQSKHAAVLGFAVIKVLCRRTASFLLGVWTTSWWVVSTLSVGPMRVCMCVCVYIYIFISIQP